MKQNVFMRHPNVQIHGTAKDVTQLADIKDDEKEQLNWAGAIHGIPGIWRETQGENVNVAVLDTGVDEDHPDLASAVDKKKDFTGGGTVEDIQGHGTHCAGVIGARLNGVGFVGAAPKCRLFIGKVLGDDGRGEYDWIADGVQWAVDEGAQIISMSLGGAVSNHKLYSVIHYALQQGVFVIAAAGNDGGIFRNSIGFPGRYGGVITVAAHDRNGNPAGFSSRGGEVDLMAPGTEIWSTYKDGGYASLSGTSMATPFVAGLAALIISKHIQHGGKTPLHNNYDLLEHLARITAHPGYHDNISGYGPLQPLSMVGLAGKRISTGMSEE